MVLEYIQLPQSLIEKAREGCGRTCWFGLSLNVFQCAVRLLLLMFCFCWKAGPSEAKRHFCFTWLNPSFTPITSQILPSSVAFRLMSEGGLAFIVSTLYTQWQDCKKIHDNCWFIGQLGPSICCGGWPKYLIHAGQRARFEDDYLRMPLHKGWPLSSAISKSSQLHRHASISQGPAYLFHIMAEYFSARHLLLNSTSTSSQDPPETTLIQFWHPSQSYFMYCFSNCSRFL